MEDIGELIEEEIEGLQLNYLLLNIQNNHPLIFPKQNSNQGKGNQGVEIIKVKSNQGKELNGKKKAHKKSPFIRPFYANKNLLGEN